MNDDQLIEHLRSALDEVHRTVPTTDFSVVPEIGRRSATRWAVAAAALVVVIAGVAAISLQRDRNVASPSLTTSVNTETPTTGASTTTLDLGLFLAAWYRLDLADFAAGPVHTEACCVPQPAPGPATVVAWGDVTGADHGLLLLTATPLLSGDPTMHYTFSNMTLARASTLEAKVVPGSGLPYVLADPTMQLLGVGMQNAGSFASQTYFTSGRDAVTLTAGDYRDQLSALTFSPWNLTQIAGVTGYRIDDVLGTTIIWHTPGETWATLHIDVALSPRVDEIVGALRQAPFPPFTPSTNDGTEYTGSATIIDSGAGPMLAFGLRESLPPQGGDIPLVGFDWSMVPGETTVAGTTWGGPYTVIGTWDGANFILGDTPTLTPAVTPPKLVITEGCTLARMAPMLDALGSLDYKALHIISTSSWNFNGHCGISITAAFDTPDIHAAAAKMGDDVTLTFVFEPVKK